MLGTLAYLAGIPAYLTIGYRLGLLKDRVFQDHRPMKEVSPGTRLARILLYPLVTTWTGRAEWHLRQDDSSDNSWELLEDTHRNIAAYLTMHVFFWPIFMITSLFLGPFRVLWHITAATTGWIHSRTSARPAPDKNLAEIDPLDMLRIFMLNTVQPERKRLADLRDTIARQCDKLGHRLKRAEAMNPLNELCRQHHVTATTLLTAHLVKAKARGEAVAKLTENLQAQFASLEQVIDLASLYDSDLRQEDTSVEAEYQRVLSAAATLRAACEEMLRLAGDEHVAQLCQLEPLPLEQAAQLTTAHITPVRSAN